MSKYIKMIDRQLKVNDKIELTFDIKKLVDNRLEYIHALDLFMHNRIVQRFKHNSSIYSIIDNQSINIRFRNGKLAKYACSCNNNLCKHILATLIAFEKEPDTFIEKDNKMSKIIHAYKKLIESMEYNTLEDDIELLNTLHTMIVTSKNDSLSQHIIGLVIISILTNIDNRYGVDTIQIVNKKVADSINSIIDTISSRDKVEKSNRSWDNIISELMNKVG